MVEEEDGWVSVSVLEDPWEVEMKVSPYASPTTRWRYRTAALGRIRTEWSIGRPPTGAHAEQHEITVIGPNDARI